jgi:hypothetical protein
VIYSESSGLAYYGSTEETLKERLSGHRSDKIAYENGTTNYCSSFRVLQHEDHKIELMAEVEVATKKELRVLEGFYQQNNHCVNIRIAGRTDAESKRAWREANRDAIKKYGEAYREANQDAKKESNRTYREANQDAIRAYREANKEKINKKHTCQCGGKYTHVNKATHFKSQKHQQLLSQQTATLTAP